MVVTNTATGATLLNTNLTYTGSDLTAGGAAGRSAQFTLPDGNLGVGPLVITVTTDSTNLIFEYNGSGTGETNNTATINATSTLGAYPDLTVTNPGITGDSTGLVTVGWSDANIGTAAASGSWTDSVVLLDVSHRPHGSRRRPSRTTWRWMARWRPARPWPGRSRSPCRLA